MSGLHWPSQLKSLSLSSRARGLDIFAGLEEPAEIQPGLKLGSLVRRRPLTGKELGFFDLLRSHFRGYGIAKFSRVIGASGDSKTESHIGLDIIPWRSPAGAIQ